MIDVNGDGKADGMMVDTTGDGQVDTYVPITADAAAAAAKTDPANQPYDGKLPYGASIYRRFVVEREQISHFRAAATDHRTGAPHRCCCCCCSDAVVWRFRAPLSSLALARLLLAFSATFLSFFCTMIA